MIMSVQVIDEVDDEVVEADVEEELVEVEVVEVDVTTTVHAGSFIARSNRIEYVPL